MRLICKPSIPHPKHQQDADKARRLAREARTRGNGWQAAFWTRIASEKDADALAKSISFDPLSKVYP